MPLHFDFKEFYGSKSFRRTLLIIVGLIFLLVVFQAGVTVGYRKAAFSYHLGDMYYRTFESHDGRGAQGIIVVPGIKENFTNLPGGYGATGKILRVNLPTFVVAGPDNIEKIIFVGSSTSIRRFRDSISATELRNDDFAVVIGTPNEQGQIVAKLIRVVPPPPETVIIVASSSIKK